MKGKKMLSGMIPMKKSHYAKGGAVEGRNVVEQLEEEKKESKEAVDGREEKACGGKVGEKRMDKKPMRRASGGRTELESNPNGANKVGAHVKSPLSGA